MKTLVSVFIGLVALISITWANTAQAIPAFARKYEKPCSSCHTAWPLLNKAGRTFKEAGYRFPSEDEHSQKISKDLYWGRNFPMSAIIKLRPYDKKDSANDPKLRAVHEVEIIVAGAIGKAWSGFFEYEAEDENNFNLDFAHAAVTWNRSRAFNIQFANAPATWSDPYDSYANRRLTRGRAFLIDNVFGGADNGGRLRTNRQTVSVYGRPNGNLFYSVGISGASGDNEGEAPGTVHARVAWDVTPKVMVGLLYIDGTCDAAVAGCAVDRDFNRTGIDVQADIGNYRISGAFLSTEDDNATATATVENDTYYIQALYVIKGANKKPTWVPLLRYDSVEASSGTTERTAITANLGYYFKENVKGYVEYYNETDDSIDGVKDSRLTLQLEVGF